jgi:hypothetical protein
MAYSQSLQGLAQHYFSQVFCSGVAAILLFSASILAEVTTSDTEQKGVGVFSLPMEIDMDSGASNGDATIYRLMPLYSLPSRKTWKVVNLDLITIADAPGGVPGRPGNPDPVPGDQEFGLGDVVHASFYTPVSSGNFIWGLGGMLNIPTATDDQLGSGKWSAGPAFRLTYRTEQWNFGVFGGQSWSFAGSNRRGDVSQLMMRAAIRRGLPNNWYFVSAPIITANWNASGQKWLVPLGGGFGKVFTVRSDPWALSLQGYYNVIKPNGAPDWAVRLSLIASIPTGDL